MPLSTEQIDFISFIDKKVTDILSNGGNEISIILSMVDEMPQFKNLINSTDKKELDKYCDSHEGFYQYMNILENMASAIASSNLKKTSR